MSSIKLKWKVCVWVVKDGFGWVGLSWMNLHYRR